jgi:HK97 family phage major capsid protein
LNAVDFDLFSATLPVLEFGKELGLESAIAAAMIADSNITQSVATSTVSGFTFANLVSLTEILPKRYQMKKFIVLSAAAHSAYAGLVSSQGQPIMTYVDPLNTQPLSFQGTPVFRSDYLNAFGANNVVGLVISLVGFRLRDCSGETVARYTQFPARPNQTGFNLFAYHGYGYVPAACAKLTCPAS